MSSRKAKHNVSEATKTFPQEIPAVDEDADAAAALLHVLPAAAALAVLGAFHAAGGLRAEDGGAEEADGRVGDFLAGCRALALDGFFRERVVVFGQADELVDGGVREFDVYGGFGVLCGGVYLSEPALRDGVKLCAGGGLGSELVEEVV